MNPLIEAHHSELMNLCRRFRVRRLEIFGSAARDHLDLETSDLDFLVEFQDLEPTAYADTYFGLLESLESLFQRPVDLVMTSAIKNPYFRQGIDQNRALLYAA